MRKAEEEKKREDALERMIIQAFHFFLSDEEYRLSYEMAQKLYNKICSILFLVPTTITGDLSVRANP